jgi:serine/threonine protein kinase
MFDPYEEWLGIPKEQRPPTHYRLLGIAINETDEEVIKSAALRLTSEIRIYQTSPQAEACTRLLNEIADARITLLDPAKRAEYDAHLQPMEIGEPDLSPVVSSVQAVYDLLLRSKLLGADEAAPVLAQWRKEAKDSEDVGRFAQWLIARQIITEYQAALLLHGHAEGFFVDHYKLLDRVGKGHLGVVYKAVHRLGQMVAIKVLPPTRARDPELLARFQRGAQLARRLRHPNVVRTFQAGEWNGLHFLVMEYLEGETLEQVLSRRGRLTPAEATRLIHQALLGLQHLHECGLVHRYLEPANLMIMPARAETTLQATLKILDISLCRALLDSTASMPANSPRLTHEGTILGPGPYLAPEQARDAHAADIRADIYSLGCILYHCLAGQPPFPDTSPMGQVIRHATETPRPLVEINALVPEGLQQIVAWMMARDPAQRYPTPERAARALEVFLASAEPKVQDTPEGHVPSFLDWLEQHHEETESASWPASPGAAPTVLRSMLRGKAIVTTRRDWIAALLGAGGLLVGEAIGMGLVQAFRRKPEVPEPPASANTR